ncbi:anti-sigma factor family protein [Kitasatospora camelliae]|uniref:Anti-sigma factor n=1 Tax=Kitasatospora camelliae TaxID=3156397 RepID=A0AAU8K8G4_9ACTN
MTNDRETTRTSETIRLSLGAYILGALSPEEDEQVTAHLAECAECRAEHAKLAGLPALLASVSEAEVAGEAPPAPREDLAEQLVERARQSGTTHRRPEVDPLPSVSQPPEESLLDGMLKEAATRRRTKRRTTRRLQAAAAAAGLLLVGAAIGGTWWGTGGSAESQGTRTTATSQAPVLNLSASDPTTGVSASVAVLPAAWGSALKISAKGLPIGTTCTLQVVSGEGTKVIGATWLAGQNPADTVTVPGAVSVPPSAIGHLNIVAGNGQNLLTIPG